MVYKEGDGQTAPSVVSLKTCDFLQINGQEAGDAIPRSFVRLFWIQQDVCVCVCQNWGASRFVFLPVCLEASFQEGYHQTTAPSRCVSCRSSSTVHSEPEDCGHFIVLNHIAPLSAVLFVGKPICVAICAHVWFRICVAGAFLQKESRLQILDRHAYNRPQVGCVQAEWSGRVLKRKKQEAGTGATKVLLRKILPHGTQSFLLFFSFSDVQL